MIIFQNFVDLFKNELIICLRCAIITLLKIWRHNMTRSYNKLLKLMIDKKINKTQLREQSGITSNAMAKISKDEPVSIEVLEKICGVLECNIEDIVEIMPEDGDAE